MDRSTLVITLALVTLFLVMGWAWYTKRRAESKPHYFGEKPDDKPVSADDQGNTPERR